MIGFGFWELRRDFEIRLVDAKAIWFVKSQGRKELTNELSCQSEIERTRPLRRTKGIETMMSDDELVRKGPTQAYP